MSVSRAPKRGADLAVDPNPRSIKGGNLVSRKIMHARNFCPHIGKITIIRVRENDTSSEKRLIWPLFFCIPISADPVYSYIPDVRAKVAGMYNLSTDQVRKLNRKWIRIYSQIGAPFLLIFLLISREASQKNRFAN